MRPKKAILLVDADERNLSVLAFTLVTHGYRVVPAATFAEGLALFHAAELDLAVVAFEGLGEKNGDDLIVAMKKLRAQIPMVLFGDPALLDRHADAVLSVAGTPTTEILALFKLMTTRKRGPRKGVAQTPRPRVNAEGAA